ncbi:MAG TPA: hypothetical protein VF945_19475 [Polyangia bacterium]
MDGLVTLAIVALVMLFAASLPYVFVESRWRWRWREVPAGRVAADGASGGVYRAGGEVPRYLQQAPRLVRVAAFTCFLFGQMFVPGLAVGLFGLVMAGVGLLSIPGLVTAWKLYGVGFALLRRDFRLGVLRAREAAAWALWLNGIIFAGSLLFVPRALDHHGTGGLIAFVDGYGALSVLQALLLRRAVRVWEDAFFT